MGLCRYDAHSPHMPVRGNTQIQHFPTPLREATQTAGSSQPHRAGLDNSIRASENMLLKPVPL